MRYDDISTSDLRQVWHARCEARVAYIQTTQQIEEHALETIGFVPPIVASRTAEADRMRSQGIVPLFNELRARGMVY